MPFFKNIVSKLLSPLLYLNMAGLGGAALLLSAQAQWQVIWIGITMVFFSPFIIPILVMPAGILSHFINVYRTAQRPDKEKTMFLLSLSYILLFLTLWCTGIFEYVTHSVLPIAAGAGLLWASTAALAPLLWWSSRDRSNIFIMTMVEVAQVAMIVLCALRILLGGSSFWPSFFVFGAILAVAAAAQVVYEEKFMNKVKEMTH